MSNALSEGWRRSIWGVIGQQLALIVHVVYLGLRLIFARVRDLSESATDAPRLPGESRPPPDHSSE